MNKFLSRDPGRGSEGASKQVHLGFSAKNEVSASLEGIRGRVDGASFSPSHENLTDLEVDT